MGGFFKLFVKSHSEKKRVLLMISLYLAGQFVLKPVTNIGKIFAKPHESEKE